MTRLLAALLCVAAAAAHADEPAPLVEPCPVGYVCLTNAEAIQAAARVRLAEANVKSCSASLAEARMDQTSTAGTIGKILFGAGVGILAHQYVTHH